MKTFNDFKIIGIDHGYGNIKTANCCFQTGVTGYDSEPLFTKDMLVEHIAVILLSDVVYDNDRQRVPVGKIFD